MAFQKSLVSVCGKNILGLSKFCDHLLTQHLPSRYYIGILLARSLH